MSDEILDIDPKFNLEVLPLMGHIKQKLLVKNVLFSPTKTDYCILKYVMNLFDKQNKTGYSVVKFIDDCLEDVQEFNGLGFLSSMARSKFNVKYEKKRYKQKVNGDVTISDELKAEMENLKKKYEL